ncbi:MAG: hypothetical protein M1825_005527 [Sarcosagium campestre]|nr:MAG: hypothetical protein M1825_005527 [Sarcosagium campestre]
MATSADPASYPPGLYLSPDQEDLLLAALSSNPANVKDNLTGNNAITHRSNRSSQLHRATPTMGISDSGILEQDSIEENPFGDYNADQDFDSSFDFDGVTGEGIIDSNSGDSPDQDSKADIHEKRKSIGDGEAESGGGGKRREGDERVPKKPGRKPLTSEPTNKRKAQNRAAQRAFRERKEKHLSDLEVKVAELEKVSESTNHENGLLRAQVEKLQSELKDYRKRLSANSTGMGVTPPGELNPAASRFGTNAQRTDSFQFDFPKFGSLPGSHIFNNGSLTKSPKSLPTQTQISPAVAYKVPGILHRDSFEEVAAPELSQVTTNSTQRSSGMEDLKDLFSPSILESVHNSPSQDYWSHQSSAGGANSRDQPLRGNSESSTASRSLSNGINASASASPSTSATSQLGPSSSCGTTPEPSTQSPTNVKLTDTALNTINEENAIQDGVNVSQANQDNHSTPATNPSLAKTPGSDVTSFDWLAQQNGGTFDPVLFGDYRESQDALNFGDYGNFFDEAYPFTDLGSTFVEPAPTQPVASKKTPSTLLEKVEQDQNAELPEIVSPENASKYLDCNGLWNHLAKREDFQSGELDVDSLCSDLKKKARCSETGVLVDKDEVDTVLQQYKQKHKQ